MSSLQYVVQHALDTDSHGCDEAIKLLIDFGADASYFTQNQKAYIHHNCVAGTMKYEAVVKEVVAPTPDLSETLMPKTYPDWEMKIETPELKDAKEAWAQIKDLFDWDPFYENLCDATTFKALSDNEECGIYHVIDGKNAFDIWVESH